MAQFKVGDRVAVYAEGRRWIAHVADVLDEQRAKDHGCEPGSLKVEVPVKLWVRWVHPKQCRRLVKKQRRSVWVMETMDGELRYGTWAVESKTTKELYSDANRWVEFREVKRK